MACVTVDLLERINRLSEIALEFHGEEVGEVAESALINSALDLSLLKEDLEDEGDEFDETFADSEE
jgi:NTP pyrophosphatase (non-canonical NTP hydrolase)